MIDEIKCEEKLESDSKKRIEQGDIFKDIKYIEQIKRVGGDNIEIHEINFPHVVVLTQDCDLSQNHKYFCEGSTPTDQDKKLLSIIVIPIYNLELFLLGEHLNDQSIRYKMQKIERYTEEGQKKVSKNKKINEYDYTHDFRSLVHNSNPRYHFLRFESPPRLPDSVIDFKHFFTVNVEALNECIPDKFVCKIGALYRELLSQRFAFYLSRIGLPDKRSKKIK